MEITWFGDTCLRLRGREGTVVADGYRSTVGPTGRGITADVVTYSRPEHGVGGRGRAPSPSDGRVAVPTSLEPAFMLDAPGEFEAHGVLVNGIRTFRDDAKGADRGRNIAFVYELDGLHTVHLGEIGHLLGEEMLGEIGTVEIACVPIGSFLAPARAAELVTQLDARLVVPLLIDTAETDGRSALDRFLHEMSVQHPEPQPRLNVTISTVPEETSVVLLESRARA